MPMTAKNNSNSLQLLKMKSNKDTQINYKNNNKINNNSGENYVIFQNHNHAELPDYSSVLKKPSNYNSINNNNNNNISNKIKYEHQEESIFNLGKPLPKSNPVIIDNNNYNNNNEKNEENLNNSNMKNYSYGKIKE
jgi:hypothetical protein